MSLSTLSARAKTQLLLIMTLSRLVAKASVRSFEASTRKSVKRRKARVRKLLLARSAKSARNQMRKVKRWRNQLHLIKEMNIRTTPLARCGIPDLGTTMIDRGL